MIVVFTDQQILSPRQVCQNCLMSDQNGSPRWHGSYLGCGKVQAQCLEEFPSHSLPEAKSPQTSIPTQVYKCQMGFNVTWIK